MGRRRSARPPRSRERRPYPRFAQLDGDHPLKRAVPGGYVDYRARHRHDGELAYFNFALAREMGLLPTDHPDRLTAELRRTLLETFALVIVNEYDFLHRRRVRSRDWLPGTYMATRYLQLQHPGRQGRTSGDGRSIWNGWVRGRGGRWDVSSCGTGVTRLCPATASEGTFFQTGNWLASYGCGTAALDEGLSAALMSEVFHRNGIATERVLAVIALPGGLAINVRAARCLLRPSHLFVHLHQNRLERLRAAADLLCERRAGNGEWPALEGAARYRHMAEATAATFARTAARFERDYVFCWMDWDGDNILADGSIIDYGSVRQFGLFHREYRFDDSDRWSTTIPEQRKKARHIAQKFAQIRDALVHGEKRPLRSYRNDPVLRVFDREFERERRRLLLRKIGFEERTVESLLSHPPPALASFERAHDYFERARAARGRVKVPDGLSWDAIFSTRDLLRELSASAARGERLSPRELLAIAASSYASRRDRRATPHRLRMARELRRHWEALVDTAARRERAPRDQVLLRLASRAAIQNRADRITGDGIDHATQRLLHCRPRLSAEETYHLVRMFGEHQNLDPDLCRFRPRRRRGGTPPPRLRRILDRMLELVHQHRETL